MSVNNRYFGAGWLNHRFDRLRIAYGRTLGVTLASRPAVYLVWIVISLSAIPMFMMSPNELAPAEDQSVLFGIINTAANSTTDQNAVYSKAAEQVMLDVPETALTFQLLFPPSIGATIGADGFSGMVLKPWAERDRTVQQILPGVQAEVSKIPGIQVFMTAPAALPGGSNFPVEFLITSTADSVQLLEFANI